MAGEGPIDQERLRREMARTIGDGLKRVYGCPDLAGTPDFVAEALERLRSAEHH